MYPFSPEELTILTSIATAAAARYAARWHWVDRDALTQAALFELVTATGPKAPAERVMARSYLYTVAVRAVRHELTFLTNVTGGLRSRSEAATFRALHDGPAHEFAEWGRHRAEPLPRLVHLLDERDNQRGPGSRVAGIVAASTVEPQYDDLFSLRSLVHAAVLRVAPGTAADVLPALVDVLAGESEVDEAAQEHGLDPLRLSWAVRRVRAHLKQDDEVRRAVGKPTVAEERALAALEAVPG